MRRLANTQEHGTQWWISHRVEPRIHAFYGSLEAYEAIPEWKYLRVEAPSEEPVVIDHGYDESKPLSELSLSDMQQVAAFRGGACLSASKQGDVDTPLEWRCAEGHTFRASPRQVLLGGHWCPECFPYPYASSPEAHPWEWDRLAKGNPFVSQLWSPLHAGEENIYGPEIFKGWEK